MGLGLELSLAKNLEGKVPNCGIFPADNNRKGRLCNIPTLTNYTQKIQTLVKTVFKLLGQNYLTAYLQTSETNQNVQQMNSNLFLTQFFYDIPDEPKLPGYIQGSHKIS